MKRWESPRTESAFVRVGGVPSERMTYRVGLIALGMTLLCSVLTEWALLTGRKPLVWLTSLLVCRVVWHLRTRVWLDASDQLSLLCLLACCVAEALHTDVAGAIALSFLASQAALAYGVAGFLKLTKPGWFTGLYPRYILSTASYGNAPLFRFVDQRGWLAGVAGGVMVLGECALAFAWLMPPPLCLAMLGFGLALHVALALLLGLPTYVWAFAALYPATYFVSMRLHR